MVLVTDSSACLPPALFYHANVRVVPIRILLPNRSVKETPESIEEIYSALTAAGQVTSAPPTLLEYLESIEDDAFDEALVLSPATEFAGMHRVATMAASLSGRSVEVVDTRSVAAGQCLVVAAALEAVVAGASAAEGAEVARLAASRTELVAAMAELGSMRHAGAGAAAGAAAPRRGHPLVRLRDGAVQPLPDPASDGGELGGLEAAWLASGGPQADETVVFHGASQPRAHELCALLGVVAEIVALSPALALQMGVGCVGAAWMRKA